MNYIEAVRKERAKYIPETGCNVVVFDPMARPGEMLTLIGHFDSKEDAEEVKQTLKGSEVYIYTPDEA